jgi:cytochrome c oxidase subunit 2
MWENLPLFPEKASTAAASVDRLFFFILMVCGFFTILIFTLVFTFAIRYRRRSPDERPRPVTGSLRLEIVWTLVPLAIAMVIFAWGSRLFVVLARPPAEALHIFAVGKQWMWKFQHLEGQREINELHVPVGQPVRLTMSSEDVIHSLFVPAFRVKADVLPGRYTRLWFEATKPGTYHLFCAEYCGTSHSEMRGRVVVMEPARFQEWLGGGEAGESLESRGARLFAQLGCATCHDPVPGARGPSLVGLFGKTVELQGGGSVTVDETYLRESIVNPQAKIVSGYQPIMPTYAGQVSEEGLLQLVVYIMSLEEKGARP